jgi:hypothetical protein
MTTIGNRLKQLRKKHKEKYGTQYTQAYISKQLFNAKWYTLSNYEQDKGELPPPKEVSASCSIVVTY